MNGYDALRIGAGLVVMLGGLAVSGCGKPAEVPPNARITMSAQQAEMCDLVETYLLDKMRRNAGNGLRAPVGLDLWVEGIMTSKGPWPFRVMRIDTTGAVVSVGTGALDVGTWTVAYVQPVANQAGTEDLAGFHGFTLPSSEVDVILDTVSTEMPCDCGTAILRHALSLKGWIDEDLTCIWFDEVDTNGWVAYKVITAVLTAAKNNLLISTSGRVNLKTREIEYNPYTGL